MQVWIGMWNPFRWWIEWEIDPWFMLWGMIGTSWDGFVEYSIVVICLV